MTLSTLVDYIILGGAAVGAIWKILEAGGKVGSKTKDAHVKLVKEVLQQEAPEYFNEYTKSQQERRDKRVKELVGPMTDAMLDIFNERFDKLESMISVTQEDIEAVEDKICNMDERLDKLQNQNSDFLRRELRKIYHKYRKYKKIPQYDFDDCQKMMEDYTGNSYAETIWGKIKLFEIVEDDDFLDE